uniref:Solute carrier family 25 member 43 n=1 Tax=Poecilia latipinna TaxID=48699 RepID=A0A3B3UKW9_9TELE
MCVTYPRSSQSFLCAGFAGLFSKTVTSPLEVVKIKRQVGTFHGKGGFLQTFIVIYQNEGLRGFWKGNMVSCLRLFPYTAVHLTTYKKCFVCPKFCLAGYDNRFNRYFIENIFARAGGLAGVAAALLTYPLEVAETRLIVQNCRQRTYIGAAHTISKIYRNEGLPALYRGFSLTVLGTHNSFIQHMRLTSILNYFLLPPSSPPNFINGCIAAGVAQTLSYPFETVKRKMQVGNKQLNKFNLVCFSSILCYFYKFVNE